MRGAGFGRDPRAAQGHAEERGLGEDRGAPAPTSCIDTCWVGPCIAVEPDGYFYGRVTRADLPEIVDAFEKGTRVEAAQSLEPETTSSRELGRRSDHAARVRARPKTSALVVIDVQERLARSMPPERLTAVERRPRILIGAARGLGPPVLYTEQYPKGLGATLPALASELEACSARRFEKLAFSACGDEEFRSGARRARGAFGRLGGDGNARLRVAHGARSPLERLLGPRAARRRRVAAATITATWVLRSAAPAGATVTTSETVAFDWLGRAGSDAFKKVSQLVR